MFRPSLIFRDDAEEAVLFISDAGGEINAVTEREQVPESIELQRRAAGGAQRFQKRASRRIVVVDLAVTEIAHPKFAFNERESPGRIQVSARDHASKEIATRIESIDETVPRPGDFIFFLRILERV